MSDELVYEMLWDCKFCGTKKLLGKSQRFCPTCGAAQDPASRYYPSDEEKVAVKDHQFVGADLICPACSSTNSGNAEFCTQCGAPLTQAARAKTLSAQSLAAGVKFESSGSRDLAKEKMEADLAQAAAVQRSRRGQARRPFIIGGVIVAIAAVIGVIVFLSSTTKQGVVVTGHDWERSINIEDYGPRAGSDWSDSVPAGAYGLVCYQDVRSHRQVPDGEDCRSVRVDQGDGTYRQERQCTTRYRDEPVYDQKCDYKIDRWQFERTITATGQSVQDAPVWPEARLARTGACNGCEREQPNGRQEKYVVHLKDTASGKVYDCPFTDQSKWASFGIETVWQMDVRRTGSPVCESLKPPA